MPLSERSTLMWRAGIIFLILGVLHVPLPQPDYHSLRHHDGCVGEVCAHHNHLLQWHGGSKDSPGEEPVFHWHWFWPGHETGQHDTDGSTTPLLHADRDTGWVEPSFCPGPPSLSPQSGRLVLPPVACLGLVFFDILPSSDSPPRQRLGPEFLGSLIRRDRAASLLQRWDC